MDNNAVCAAFMKPTTSKIDNSMTTEITGIAMSGGVDSTATAILAQQEGSVRGFFMKLEQPNYEKQLERVMSIAAKLGIELEVIDLEKQFQKCVLDYFSTSYFKGLTPNPCVICNRDIKFGLFLQTLLAKGVNKVATGHYAQVKKSAEAYELHKGIDPYKDQSYFLSRLRQDQLSHVRFPLGTMHKSDIYDLVEQHGFLDFRGTESQDVCFLEKDNVADFLEKAEGYTKTTGNIVTRDGKILGRHLGLHRYTVGQRKGLGISHTEPLYVIGLNIDNNSVIVGENEQLFTKTIHLDDMHWIHEIPERHSHITDFEVRIRSTHKGGVASLSLLDNNQATVMFSEAQRAITPGQFAVIYKGTEVIGSGVIL